MMKKRKKVAILVGILVFMLVGCGKSDKYYPETKLSNMETFTSVTGIEVNVSDVTEDGSGIAYNYLMDNNAEGMGAITKYEQYLRDYGFGEKEDLGNGYYAYYKDATYCLTTGTFYPQDNIIQYVMCVPKGTMQDTKDAVEAQEAIKNAEKDELLPQLIALCEEKKYDEAVDFYKNSALSEEFEGYGDSKKYFFYAEAGQYMNKSFYADAYDMYVEDCDGVIDTNELISEIVDKVSFLDGVYLYEDKDVPGLYKHMYIMNGHVAFDSAVEKAAETKIMYAYTLLDYGSDFGVGYGGVGSSGANVEYVMNTSNPQSITVKQGPDGIYDTFVGTYKKVSSTPVPQK